MGINIIRTEDNMKQVTYLLVAFALFACNTKTAPIEKVITKRVSSIVLDNDTTISIKYQYNSQGLLSSILRHDYQGSDTSKSWYALTIPVYDSSSKLIALQFGIADTIPQVTDTVAHYEYKIGLITRIYYPLSRFYGGRFVDSLVYDGDNKVKKIYTYGLDTGDRDTTLYSLEWNDKKLTKLNTGYSNPLVCGRENSYTYDNKVNIFTGVNSAFYIFNVHNALYPSYFFPQYDFPFKGNNCLNERSNNSGTCLNYFPHEYTYSYQYDQDNYPEKITFTNMQGTDTIKYHFTVYYENNTLNLSLKDKKVAHKVMNFELK
ncbi:MAG: hypothetical protein J0I41_13980 [Filimonas sp.]|nr:hypothetical protein [Filimonas sp.]